MAKVHGSWFGAQRESEGRPVLLRGRNPDEVWKSREDFPVLLSIDYLYEPANEDGLPSEVQLADLQAFEAAAFDKLDHKDGLLVLSLTWSGTVRYFVYVDDVDAIAAAIEKRAGAGRTLEFSTLDDPEWEEVRLELEPLGLAPSRE